MVFVAVYHLGVSVFQCCECERGLALAYVRQQQGCYITYSITAQHKLSQETPLCCW